MAIYNEDTYDNELKLEEERQLRMEQEKQDMLQSQDSVEPVVSEEDASSEETEGETPAQAAEAAQPEQNENEGIITELGNRFMEMIETLSLSCSYAKGGCLRVVNGAGRGGAHPRTGTS